MAIAFGAGAAARQCSRPRAPLSQSGQIPYVFICSPSVQRGSARIFATSARVCRGPRRPGALAIAITATAAIAAFRRASSRSTLSKVSEAAW